VRDLKPTRDEVDFDDPKACMSRELMGHKGSYVVLAGVFKGWEYVKAQIFAGRLSKEFGTEVLIMSWDESSNKVQCNIFLDGDPLLELCENPIGRVLRRIC